MSPLKTVYLSLPPRLRVPCSSLCVHRDRRPDLNSKWRPFTLFFSVFFKVFGFGSCLFVPRQGSRHSSFRPSPCQVGMGVRRDQKTPLLPSYPRRASCSCLVLFVWPRRAVLSCSCLFGPGGLLLPPSCPMEIFLGG